MPKSLTYQERKDRADTAWAEMQALVAQIDAGATGQERGRLLRMAKSKWRGVGTNLSVVAAGRVRRAEYTDAQRREAKAMLDRAAALYQRAWASTR